MSASAVRDLAVSLNTLGPRQTLRIGLAVGGGTPTKPRAGVIGLDLEAVPDDLKQYLVTVFRGPPPSHLVDTVEGYDRGRLNPGDVTRQQKNGDGGGLAPGASGGTWRSTAPGAASTGTRSSRRCCR